MTSKDILQRLAISLTASQLDSLWFIFIDYFKTMDDDNRTLLLKSMFDVSDLSEVGEDEIERFVEWQYTSVFVQHLGFPDFEAWLEAYKAGQL